EWHPDPDFSANDDLHRLHRYCLQKTQPLPSRRRGFERSFGLRLVRTGDDGMSSVTLAVPQNGFAVAMRDYSELIKARVTTLVVVTAACGFFLGARKGGFPSLSWQM